MNDPIFSPCPGWAEKLAVFQSKELSSAERNALDVHIASCLDCKAVLDTYLELDERLHEALNVRRPLHVSAEMLELENRYSVEEEHAVFTVKQKDCIFRRKLVFWSVPRKRSISYRISFGGKMLDTIAPLLVIGILLISFFSLYYIKHPMQGVTTSGGHSTVTSHSPTPTPYAQPTVASTATFTPKLYPHLVASYNGSIVNGQNGTAPMTLTLTHIQQNNGLISGSFSGLNIRAPLSGLLTPSKPVSVTFTVAGGSGHSPLSFTGVVQADGKLSGSFCTVDQRGSCNVTGDDGTWSAMPVTT